MSLQLKAVLKEIDGNQVFPIHTDKAELFAGFIRDLQSKTAVVSKGKEYMV